jgi:NitT/TauT family transport system substrate-binding protein
MQTSHAPVLVGTARGTFKSALGPEANLDVKTFTNGPNQVEALFAGEVDLGYVGPNSAINGYVKSRGEGAHGSPRSCGVPPAR